MRRREFIATALVAPLLAGWGRHAPAAPAFLDGGSHDALLVRDEIDEPAAARVERATVRESDSLRVDFRPGGGFVGRFS